MAVLRDGLAARGWTVRELNEPLGASTADKVAAAGSAAAAARLAGRQAGSWSRLAKRSRGARASGGPDVVLVGYQGHADVHLARALFPKARIVLDHLTGLAETVADRGLGSGPKLQALQAADRAAFAAADVIVVDTAEQAAALPAAARAKAVVVPVGAGRDWIDAGAAAGREPDDRLRVVFFGLFTPLQGAPVIGEAIAALADAPIDFTMVGHGQDLARAKDAAAANPNVTWIDWVAAADLPALVAQHDVSLGIFGTGPKSGRVIPTKVYQGMAAGCAIVTAATPAIDVLADAVISVPAGDSGALAGVLESLADDAEALAAARDRARRAASRFAPAEAVEALDEVLREPRLDRPNLPPLTLNAWLRWDVIRREVQRADPRTILEVGPGEGAMACRLAVGRSYTGVELSDRTRTITAERLESRGTPGRLLSTFDELGDEQFDLVCAFEVLEHIDDDASALREWVHRIKPGGTLVLSTPADPDRMGPHDVIAGHFRRYSGEQLTKLALDNGLVDVRAIHVGYPAGYALEAVRNRAARSHPALDGAADGDLTPQDVVALTEQSSSIMQPPMWAGLATQAVSAPARWLQRLRPTVGTGVVLVAHAPA